MITTEQTRLEQITLAKPTLMYIGSIENSADFFALRTIYELDLVILSEPHLTQRNLLD